MSHEKFQSCIEACYSCATICNHCTTSCLNEKDVLHMAKCIQLNLECAAICRVTAELLSLGSSHAKHMLALCLDICDACATECENHSMGHCRRCAEVCRSVASVCRETI